MKYIKNFNDHINEMSVQKDWFKKHKQHSLSQLPVNTKYSKKDLSEIEFKPFGHRYYVALHKGNDLAYINSTDYNKKGIINLEILKASSLSLIALLIIKITRNLKSLGLKRKDIYFSFKMTAFDYLSFKHTIIEEIKKIEKGENYLMIKSFIVNSKDKELKKLYSNNIDEIRGSLKKIELTDINLRRDYNFSDQIEYYISLKSNYTQLIFNYMEANDEEFTASDFEDLDTFIDKNIPFIKIKALSGEVDTSPLPNIMKGTGLGYKIYKKVIMDSGFAKSGDTSKSALQVWKKLIQDKDFYYILLLGDNVAVIYKDQKRENIIDAFNILTKNSTVIEIDKDLKKYPETQMN